MNHTWLRHDSYLKHHTGRHESDRNLSGIMLYRHELECKNIISFVYGMTRSNNFCFATELSELINAFEIRNNL